MEVSHLHPEAHILRAIHVVEKIMEQAGSYVRTRLEPMAQPRGESGNVAKKSGIGTKHLDLLLGTVCNESYFEKSKVPR